MTEPTSSPRNTWQADETHPSEAEAIRTALRQVVDPELGLNIIELGLVRELEIEDDQVQLRMILTTPFCPYAPAMLERARLKAEEASGKTVVMELGMEAWDPSMMEEGAGAAWGF